MQADRSGIAAVADDCEHLPATGRLAAFDQRGEQQTSDAAPACGLVDIDRVFDGEAVGRPQSEPVDVGIAQHPIALVGNQIGEAVFHDIGAPTGHLGQIRRRDLEGAGAMQDMVGIDRLDGVHVGVAAVADQRSIHGLEDSRCRRGALIRTGLDPPRLGLRR